MTKKSIGELLHKSPEKLQGRTLSARVSSAKMKKIEEDMDEIAVRVRDGSVRPSYETLASFVLQEHGVDIGKTTARSLFSKAQQRIENA